MADLSSFTPKYNFPYPLAGDSVQNTYSRIEGLAVQVESVLNTLGVDYPVVAGKEIMQRGDAAGGALTGTYPSPTLDPSVALPNGITATTQAQSDGSTKVATTAYVDAYIAGTLPDGSVGTAELADGAVTNVKVNASAAISYSKLALTGSILVADLAFDPATQAELDAHTGASTSVHGITNTANLVYTVDARLSDARTPTSHAASHGSAGSDAVTIAPSQVTGTAVITSDSRLTDARTPTGGAGGVLSGTYPNPGFSVDMATQSELDTHASDTTSVHGIADTSVLATATDVSTAVSTHSSDTTSVHGISNTADLVLTGDARLSDARTPTAHAGTHVPGGTDAIDLTKITAIAATLPTLPDALYPAGALIGIGSVAPYLLYRSAGSAWDQIGGAGGGSIEISDTAPSTPDEGNLWFDSTTGKTFIWYVDGSSDQWVEVGEASQLAIPSHGSSHVRGGSDIIDGDRLTVDYVPSYYTRNSAASGAGDNTDLTAHLSGVNNNFEKIRVDSNGRVTLPYQPAFYAQGSITGVLYSNAVLPYDQCPFNRGNYYNTTNSRFTAPVSGFYHFDLTALNYPSTGSSAELSFLINGSGVTGVHRFWNVATQQSIAAHLTYYLNANDYIQPYGTIYLHNGGNLGQFSGFLIG